MNARPGDMLNTDPQAIAQYRRVLYSAAKTSAERKHVKILTDEEVLEYTAQYMETMFKHASKFAEQFAKALRVMLPHLVHAAEVLATSLRKYVDEEEDGDGNQS